MHPQPPEKLGYAVAHSKIYLRCFKSDWEYDLKTEDNLKNEDDLKIEDDLNM